MDDYTLDIDLEKKTAIMILPFITMNYDDDEATNHLISVLRKSDTFIFTVSGNDVQIKVKHDFAKYLSSDIWNINSSLNNSMSLFLPNDKSVLQYSNYEFKKALGRHIIDNYLPAVLSALKQSSNEFVSKYNA